MPDARTDVATRVQVQDAQLASSALAVLDANWLGHATAPSPVLYPHQWSWDSACIAMGYARFDQARAETELRSLFAGQWRNGLLPHIVFTEATARYFPGPGLLADGAVAGRPGGAADVRHRPAADSCHRGVAALPAVLRPSALRRSSRARAPKLAAWHDYLYRERTRGGDGLVEIWHPWESGHGQLAPLGRGARPDRARRRRRSPTTSASTPSSSTPPQRPTDAEYDRYAYLVGLFRGARLPTRPDPRRDAVRDPVRPLQLAPRPGGPGPGRDRALRRRRPRAVRALGGADGRRRRREALGRGAAVYLDYDVRRRRRVGVRQRRGFAPLYAGIPTDERARRMIAVLGGFARRARTSAAWAVTSLAPDDPGFDADALLAGPDLADPQLGRSSAGSTGTASATSPPRSARALIELSRGGGFWEHYSPMTGSGQGGEHLSWTAGLVLDVLATELE